MLAPGRSPEGHIQSPQAELVQPKARLLGLDLLRLLAILLVLGRHMDAAPETWPTLLRSISHAWNRGGWVGVDLFFVLSGFLVSGLLFAEYKRCGRFSILNFYARRGWRIYPPFFAMIAFSVIILTLVLHKPVHPWPLVSELLFLQSYLPGLWNHTWSLAVEEHFYLSLPIALMVTLGFKGFRPPQLKTIIRMSIAVAIAALILRLLNWHYRETYSHMNHLFATHLRFDALFFGVAISYAYHFHRATFIEVLHPRRILLLITGCLLLVPAFILQLETSPFIYTIGLTLFSLGSSALIIWSLLNLSRPNGRMISFFAMLGTYSYSIYLWHMPFAVWAIPLIERGIGTSFDFTARTAIYLVGSIAFGIVMGKAVEVPTIRLRDRLHPTRSAAI
jgi:peptidoglycan/LPS O-acetylase OafA/YrhL